MWPPGDFFVERRRVPVTRCTFVNIFGSDNGNGDPRSAELNCKYLAERLLRYVECGAWILSFINQYVQSLNMSPP